MLPSQLQPRRRTAPQPSSSLIAMQQQGLELTIKDADFKLTDDKVPHQYTQENPLSQSDAEPTSPNESYLTRSSSIYSSESAYSDDSAGTTISQILDMYIDIISKLPYGNGDSEAVVVQPIAYRDTIAPLLRKRFSTESEPQLSISELESHPFPPILPLRKWNKPSQTSLSSSYQQAPGFQEFSRNLRGRRGELVSPLTTTSSDYNSQLNLDALSQPSPTTSQVRPFSFVDDEKVGIGDSRTISPFLDPAASSDIPLSIPEMNRGPRDDHCEQTPRPIRLSQPTECRYVNSKDLLAQKLLSRQSDGSHQDESSRFHRHHSTGSRSTDSFVMYSGFGEAVKAMVKDKIQRRKEAKETARMMMKASQRYPAMQQRRVRPSDDQRRSSLKNGIEHVLRRVSITGSNDNNHVVTQAWSGGKRATPPLIPYQKYGVDLWPAKNKTKRKEERQQERERRFHRSQEVRFEHRLTSSDSYRPGHRRAFSARTMETGRSPTTTAKNGLAAAVESAKHSLTHSSAEKRREKLKESIVVVGPAELTLANAQASAGVLQ